MAFALSQAVASGDAFEHRPPECGHCVQNFLADLNLRDLPGEAGSVSRSGGTQNPSARWGLKLGVRLLAKTLVATKVSRGRYDGFGTFV